MLAAVLRSATFRLCRKGASLTIAQIRNTATIQPCAVFPFARIASPESVCCAENGRYADEEAICARGISNGAQAAEVCGESLEGNKTGGRGRRSGVARSVVAYARTLQPRRMARSPFMVLLTRRSADSEHIAKAGTAGRVSGFQRIELCGVQIPSAQLNSSDGHCVGALLPKLCFVSKDRIPRPDGGISIDCAHPCESGDARGPNVS